jgi:hypothetical protein
MIWIRRAIVVLALTIIGMVPGYGLMLIVLFFRSIRDDMTPHMAPWLWVMVRGGAISGFLFGIGYLLKNRELFKEPD